MGVLVSLLRAVSEMEDALITAQMNIYSAWSEADVYVAHKIQKIIGDSPTEKFCPLSIYIPIHDHMYMRCNHSRK